MYVGAIPTTGDFKLLDSITTSSATTFNLRQGGVAVYPQSANHCIVQLNGVNQVPGSSFNIVNDTIVFASSLSSDDVINQILVLGNVNDIGVPSDDTVSTAKLQSSAVTDAKISAMASSKLTGVVPTANLGSGTASSSTVLFGDQTFKTAPSGGLVLISSGNGTNAASLQLESVFTSTYTNYLFVGTFKPSSDAVDLQGNYVIGTTVKTANEYVGIGRSWLRNTSSVSQGNSNGWGDGHMRFASASSSSNDNYGQNVNMYFYNPLATSSTNTPAHPHILFDAVNWADDNQIVRTSGAVNYNQTGNYNGFRWIYSSGNINFYNYSLFGITGS